MTSFVNQIKTALKPWAKARTLGWRMGMSRPHAWSHSARAWMSHKSAGAPRPMRILVVGDGLAYCSDQQYAPMTRHIAALRREFGHVLQFRLLDDVLEDRSPDFSGYDAVFLKFTFLASEQRAREIADAFRKRASASATPLIYFDGDDDMCVQWRSVLQASDVYIKKHAFTDRTAYEREYVGRSNLTDYAARNFGFDFSRDHVPTAAALAPQEVAKIRVGWNIALDDKIYKLASELASRQTPVERDIDVMCRASNTKPGTLIYALRNPAAVAIESLADQFKVLAPTQHVNQEEYYREMLRSKMCVCPYGYGELCWRDFEAALCGCLVLKPDMAHMETAPDLFVPHQTYVPLAWDYSDLREKVAYYTARPQELDRIAKAGQRALHQALTQEWFIDRYRDVVASALAPSRVASPSGAPVTTA